MSLEMSHFNPFVVLGVHFLLGHIAIILPLFPFLLLFCLRMQYEVMHVNTSFSCLEPGLLLMVSCMSGIKSHEFVREKDNVICDKQVVAVVPRGHDVIQQNTDVVQPNLHPSG